MAALQYPVNGPVQAAILCGGLGTRMRPYTEKMPKPMVTCNGKPFLWYLIQQLQEQGIRRFVLLTGYLSKKIEDYFEDGSRWGVEIQYSQGPVEWDTGRRLWEAKSILEAQFLLLYSDNFVPFPLQKVLERHIQNKSSLSLMISQKSPGNISVDENGLVLRYDRARTEKGCNYVEIGYMVVERDRTFEFYEQPNCNFSSILASMAERGELGAWIQQDAYHSISDPERWKKAEEYLKPKKILLIDRDGVINRKAPRGEYICTWEEFEWLPDTLSAMKELAREGFQFIVITNQAGIARQMIDPTQVDRIHRNMTVELEKEGVVIQDVYICPHHWNEGCFCRKPQPGMLFQASRDHLFRLDQTVFVGDDPRDEETARNAGCASILVDPGENGNGDHLDSESCISNSLMDALIFIKDYYS